MQINCVLIICFLEGMHGHAISVVILADQESIYKHEERVIWKASLLIIIPLILSIIIFLLIAIFTTSLNHVNECSTYVM